MESSGKASQTPPGTQNDLITLAALRMGKAEGTAGSGGQASWCRNHALWPVVHNGQLWPSRKCCWPSYMRHMSTCTSGLITPPLGLSSGTKPPVNENHSQVVMLSFGSGGHVLWALDCQEAPRTQMACKGVWWTFPLGPTPPPAHTLAHLLPAASDH